MSRFSYDVDDTGFDDFEYAMEDSDSGLFDKHTDKREDGVTSARVAGRGSVYEVAQALDDRELLDEEGNLPEDLDEHMEDLTDDQWDDLEVLLVRADGELPVVWEAMEDHNIYFNPWYEQYEEERQYERYWGAAHGYEKVRHKRAKKEKYWKDPEKSRLVQRQKNKKHYHSLTPEERRTRNREQQRARRARRRAEKEAQKNGR